jgi:hypothetical protein
MAASSVSALQAWSPVYIEEPGAGEHCFYYAISDALGETPVGVAAGKDDSIRTKLADDVLAMVFAVDSHAKGPRDRDEYFAHPSTRDMKWGGNAELIALVHAFNDKVCFHVYSQAGKHVQHYAIGSDDALLHVSLHYCNAAGALGRPNNHWNVVLLRRSVDGVVESRGCFTRSEFAAVAEYEDMKARISECIAKQAVIRIGLEARHQLRAPAWNMASMSPLRATMPSSNGSRACGRGLFSVRWQCWGPQRQFDLFALHR